MSAWFAAQQAHYSTTALSGVLCGMIAEHSDAIDRLSARFGVGFDAR
jgi:hypothetical protein